MRNCSIVHAGIARAFRQSDTGKPATRTDRKTDARRSCSSGIFTARASDPCVHLAGIVGHCPITCIAALFRCFRTACALAGIRGLLAAGTLLAGGFFPGRLFLWRCLFFRLWGPFLIRRPFRLCLRHCGSILCRRFLFGCGKWLRYRRLRDRLQDILSDGNRAQRIGERGLRLQRLTGPDVR